MRQIILLMLAGICFVAAVLSLPLPLPLGFIFSVVGLSLLLLASPATRRRFQELRIRYPNLDRRIQSVERHMPGFIRRALNGGPGYPNGHD